MNENLKRHRPDIKVLGEGKAIAFMPEDPMGVWVHIQEVRDLIDVKDKEIADLKEQYKDMDVTHTVHIAKMNAKIEELEESLESEKASRYADSVDAGMRERRLKRALWLARAERASEKVDLFFYARASTELLNINGCTDRIPEPKGWWRQLKATEWMRIWQEVERKCRAKAEDYK